MPSESTSFGYDTQRRRRPPSIGWSARPGRIAREQILHQCSAAHIPPRCLVVAGFGGHDLDARNMLTQKSTSNHHCTRGA